MRAPSGSSLRVPLAALLAGWTLGLGAAHVRGQTIDSASSVPPGPAYETREVEGWKVFIQRGLIDIEPGITARALELLRSQLAEISRRVPAAAAQALRAVPLYFSPEYPDRGPGAEFHPDAGWLRANGRDPAMEQAIEFSNIPQFEADMDRMPNFTLHELSHAYHYRVLPGGFENPEVKAAYERARSSGRYDRVERWFGTGKTNTFERAYALTDPMEYFAETSEAFFSRNDFFPFTRAELKRHDPEMFSLLEKLWGLEEKSRHSLIQILALGAACAAAAANPLVFENPQVAGISGFRAFWDSPIVLAGDGPVVETRRTPGGAGPNAVWAPEKREGGAKPGAIVFDAVHRSALVRFPGSGERIAGELRKGFALEKLELLLPHRATELWAEGYAEPPGMSFLGDAWEKQQPRWHAVAWALRQPWTADHERGPTFNASANGVAYWKQFGAGDENEDRFPRRFGPAEVSAQVPEGRLDLTPLLTDPAFGATVADRLRVLEHNGVLVRKWETYDLGFWPGGYEWGTATGGRGILVHAPKLVVTFKPASPAPLIPDGLSEPVAATPRGQPSAVMPDAAAIRAFAARHTFQRPGWMPDWQWQRVQELKALGRVQDYPSTPEAYGKWIDAMLAKPPRTWDGFQAAEMTQEYALFAETWPAPVREHWKLYWWAWLMPDRAHQELAQGYIGGRENREYIQRTGDWRGNASVYRTYCRAMGTMNFNHWAANGTLLGGHILGSEAMVNEGRHGLETFPLRTWCWFDGSTQETLDHYYFSISLKDQKVFADFGPTLFDRMMGRNILAKSVGELAALYHPALRRFISSSGRTGIAYLLAIQDGTKHIVHTLSREGVLTDLGRQDIPGGMPMLGHDADPGMIAQQTLNGPWGDAWLANVVDQKPLPFETTASYKQWGNFGATPLWKRSYLGRHYGLATIDVAIGNQTVPLMAQWRRDDRPAGRTEQIGTLLARFGVNRTEFLDTIWHGTTQRNPNGGIGQQGGFIASLQHRNKLLAFTSPYPALKYSGDRNLGTNITSVQTSIALIDLQPKPTWRVCLDGQPVEHWPVKATFGQRFTIQDGATFIGLIPLPGASDLGRDAEVVLSEEGELTEMQGGGKLKTSLVLNIYNYRSDAPLDVNQAGLDEAWGGFALEISDATEFPDFAAFQKHIAAARVEASWDQTAKTVHARFVSGTDDLEAGFKPDYTGDWDRQTPTDQCFPYRRVNGAWPYLAKDIERETSLGQMSRTGQARKAGAALTVEPGRMACVEFEPVSGVFVGYTPLPDATSWKLELPGGIIVEPDGKAGMLRVTVSPGENLVDIEYAARPGESIPGMATTLRVQGLKEPSVRLNGRPATLNAEGRIRLPGDP